MEYLDSTPDKQFFQQQLLKITVRAMLIVGILFNGFMAFATIYPVFITHQLPALALYTHIINSCITLGLGYFFFLRSPRTALHIMIISGSIGLYAQILITYKPDIFGMFVVIIVLPALLLSMQLIFSILIIYTFGFLLLIQQVPEIVKGVNWWVIVQSTWGIVIVMAILGQAIQRILHDYAETLRAYHQEQQLRQQHESQIAIEKEIRTFISSYNHELGGLVDGIQGLLPLILDSIPEQRMQRVFQTTVEQLDATIQEVSLLTRSGILSPYQLVDVDLCSLIRGTLEEFKVSHPHIHFYLTNQTLTLAIEPALIRLAINTALRNAIDAIKSQAIQQIWIDLDSDSTHAILQIRDNGNGFDSDLLQEINDHLKHHTTLPQGYFSTKNRGSGRGLPLIAKVAELHGGHLELANHLEGGAVVRFTLARTMNVSDHSNDLSVGQ